MTFTWNGRAMSAHAGESVAAALWAAGVRSAGDDRRRTALSRAVLRDGRVPAMRGDDRRHPRRGVPRRGARGTRRAHADERTPCRRRDAAPVAAHTRSEAPVRRAARAHALTTCSCSAPDRPAPRRRSRRAKPRHGGRPRRRSRRGGRPGVSRGAGHRPARRGPAIPSGAPATRCVVRSPSRRSTRTSASACGRSSATATRFAVHAVGPKVRCAWQCAHADRRGRRAGAARAHSRLGAARRARPRRRHGAPEGAAHAAGPARRRRRRGSVAARGRGRHREGRRPRRRPRGCAAATRMARGLARSRVAARPGRARRAMAGARFSRTVRRCSTRRCCGGSMAIPASRTWRSPTGHRERSGSRCASRAHRVRRRMRGLRTHPRHRRHASARRRARVRCHRAAAGTSSPTTRRRRRCRDSSSAAMRPGSPGPRPRRGPDASPRWRRRATLAVPIRGWHGSTACAAPTPARRASAPR